MGFFVEKARRNRKIKQLRWNIRLSKLIGLKSITGIDRQRMLSRFKILQKLEAKNG